MRRRRDNAPQTPAGRLSPPASHPWRTHGIRSPACIPIKQGEPGSGDQISLLSGHFLSEAMRAVAFHVPPNDKPYCNADMKFGRWFHATNEARSRRGHKPSVVPYVRSTSYCAGRRFCWGSGTHEHRDCYSDIAEALKVSGSDGVTAGRSRSKSHRRLQYETTDNECQRKHGRWLVDSDPVRLHETRSARCRRMAL